MGDNHKFIMEVKKLVKYCPNCKTSNPNSAEFCQNCGQELGTISSGAATQSQNNEGIGGWWNKQGTGAKAAIGIGGICCIGLILIVAFAGMFSSDQTTTTDTNTETNTSTPSTPTPAQEPTVVTISQLYSNGVSEGTLVKVTGTVLQTDGYDLRLENSDGQDILIQGTDLNAYEDQSVTVIGTFIGPTSYTTAIGSSRTVPTIDDAKIA